MGDIKNTITTIVREEGIDKLGFKFDKLREKIKITGSKSSQTFEKFTKNGEVLGKKTTTTTKMVNKAIEDRIKRLRYIRLQERLQAQAEKMNILIARAGVQERKRGVKSYNDIIRASRRFKMELLSVMFFGLGIKRAFQGLLSPALELVGVFDIFTTTLQILFLPVALMILDWAIWLMDKVANLSDFWKKLIGWFAIGGVILGTALFLFGMLSLGIAGITMAFSGLISTVSNLFGGGAIGGLMSAILVLIPGLSGLGWVSEKLKTIWDSIMDSPFGEKIKGIWEKIKTKVTEVIGKIKTLLAEQGISLDDMIKKLGLGEGGLGGMWDKLKKKWDDDIKPMLTGLQESFKKITDNLPSLTTSMNLLVETLKKVGSALEFISKHREILGILVGGAIGASAGPAGMVIGAAAGGILAHKSRGGRQSGGYIPQTGLYNLHAGENVIPANQSFTSSPTINIYTSGGVDSFSLNQIQDIIARELSSISRR